ncbi:MAG: tetratricopeptide repeat protein, partial [Prevotella sp.]|nr:tetratricopeptide repeat protein [Prevotella sp.]
MLASCGADRALKKGDKYFALGEYYDAATQYKRAYQMTPPKEREKRGQISRKLATSNDRINSSQKAIAAYRNVIRYKQDDLLTHLNLAQQLLTNGNYKEAAQEYQIVLDSMPDNQLARSGLKSAQTAADTKKRGSRYTVKKMDVFNSRRAEYSPMLLGDDNEYLYFTSTRNEAEGDELSG